MSAKVHKRPFSLLPRVPAYGRFDCIAKLKDKEAGHHGKRLKGMELERGGPDGTLELNSSGTLMLIIN